MNKLPYYRLPDPPEKMTATGLMIRFVDSLGFRYRWATEGLREEDMEFQACDSSMKLRELLAHIHGLITSTDAFITGNDDVSRGCVYRHVGGGGAEYQLPFARSQPISPMARSASVIMKMPAKFCTFLKLFLKSPNLLSFTHCPGSYRPAAVASPG